MKASKGGVLVEKLFCSFFNPATSLYIYYDQYEYLYLYELGQIETTMSDKGFIIDDKLLRSIGLCLLPDYVICVKLPG